MSSHRPRALYIEDDPLVADIVKEALAPICEVDVEPDGLAALERAATQPPDLMLVDLQLPTLGGFEILQRLRRSPQLVMIPVVVLSARCLADEQARAKELGCAAFVEKPFAIDNLRGVVLSALGTPSPQTRAD